MAHAKFRIDGDEYDVPTIDTFTMDETIVLYNYSGLTVDELEDVEGLHPGLMTALIHVAIQRANPELKGSKVKATVGAMNLMDVLKEWKAAADSDEDTEDESDPPQPPSPRSSSGSETFSGDGSASDSVDPEPGSPDSSGTPE